LEGGNSFGVFVSMNVLLHTYHSDMVATQSSSSGA